MLRNLGLRSLVAAALLVLLPATSQAYVRFCNDFAQTVFVAVAYQTGHGNWYARGWLSVPNGQCSEFNNPPMHVATFLYRAETDDYVDNGHKVRETWGDRGKRSFAVTDSGFAWDHADSPNGKPSDARMAGFVDTNATADDGDLKATITFGADASNDLTISTD